MFAWLADLLVKIPIQGSGCACCEAKKIRLKQMQKEILDIENNEYSKHSDAEIKCQDTEIHTSIKSYYRYKL